MTSFSIHYRLPETSQERTLIAAFETELAVYAAMGFVPETTDYDYRMDERRYRATLETARDISLIRLTSLKRQIERMMPAPAEPA